MTTKDWTAHVDGVTRWMRDGAPDATKPALMGHAWLAVAEIITGQKFASSVQAMRYLIESARQGLGVEAYLSKASDLGELVTCGSPQIVEGLRLRGVRDGRRGGLLVIDR